MKAAWSCFVLGVTLAACKSDAARRAELEGCSERSSDALEIQLCLESNYGWKEAEAGVAAAARARELDSVETLRADAIWARDDARHRDEIRDCGESDLTRCLVMRYAWPEERAVRAADSTWAAAAPRHQREIQDCLGQRQSSVGSCLTLRYKWPTRRALALDDSIQRARMR